MAKTRLNVPIRVVFYLDESRWVAHCLEFDLLGDGQNKQEAVESLRRAIAIQVEQTMRNGNVKNLLSPAPPEYWQKYAEGRHVNNGDFQIVVPFDSSVEIPSEDFRVYTDAGSEPESDVVTA